MSPLETLNFARTWSVTCPAQVAGEPVYDTLRTKEQLGYSVNAAVRLTHGMLGFAVVVVSGARSPSAYQYSAAVFQLFVPKDRVGWRSGSCFCHEHSVTAGTQVLTWSLTPSNRGETLEKKDIPCTGEHGPAHLDARVDAFLGGYEAALAALEPEALERHRAALIAAKLQKDRGLADEASRHWEQIATRRCAPCLPGQARGLIIIGYACAKPCVLL